MANKPFAAVNMKTGETYINKSKNRSGIQYLDSAVHESNHFHNPKMSERDIINKTQKDRDSYLSII